MCMAGARIALELWMSTGQFGGLEARKFRQWRGGSNAPPTTIVDTDHTDHTEKGNTNPCDP